MEDNELMFEESVWPFYQQTLELSNIDYVVNGTVNDTMEIRPLKKVVDEIMDKIHNKLHI